MKTSNKFVFFNAFACDPEKGSEFGLGWNWATYVAKHYSTLLVTADRGRKDILLDAIQSDPEIRNNLSVVFLPWKLPDDCGSRVLLKYFQPYFYIFYRRWLRSSFLLAREMCQDGKVRLVHQNTYHTFREPGDFWRLPVPSVWAPVAGTSEIPWRLLPSLGSVEGFRHAARNVINQGHKRFNQRFRWAVRGYSKVIAGSDEAAGFFRAFRPDVDIIPGQLIRTVAPKLRRNNSCREPLQLVFCGLHHSRKGGEFLIESLSRAVSLVALHLHMVGEGLMTERWKRLAEIRGVASSITWHGRVQRNRVLEIFGDADVFVFPSLNDCYPSVIAEAFSIGLPVITTDIPGVGDMVDERSGYRLCAYNRECLIQGFTEVFVDLAENPSLLKKLQGGVRKRANEFLFEDRMKRLDKVYRDLLD